MVYIIVLLAWTGLFKSLFYFFNSSMNKKCFQARASFAVRAERRGNHTALELRIKRGATFGGARII